MVTATEPEKPAIAVGKKRDVQTTVVSTSERQNHVENNKAGSRQRIDDMADDKDRQKKDVAVHAAKRKKFTRNEKLIVSDGFNETDKKPTPTPTTDSSVADRKSVSTAEVPPDRSENGTKSVPDRVQSLPVVEKMRDDSDTAVEANKTGHVISEKKTNNVDIGAPSFPSGESVSTVERVTDKDRADILDDIDDDVADSFALFATIKSTSGAVEKTASEELLPVSQPQQTPLATSRTDSYDQLPTGGAAIAMADSGYQTYDHDLAALDDRQPQPVPDHPKSVAKPEVTSELEVQSSISEPDMVDTVARYSASSDSEMSVELPSCASSSGADKPTTLDWQLPQAASITQDDISDGDAMQPGKVARRASEEDLEQLRSVGFRPTSSAPLVGRANSVLGEMLSVCLCVNHGGTSQKRCP